MKKRVVTHGLTDMDRVRASIEEAVKANAERLAPYSPRLMWNGPRAAALHATVLGKSIRADFAITDDDVQLQGEIPFVFSHFEDRIMTRLCEELEQALARARGGA
jgi:hypothetical protein